MNNLYLGDSVYVERDERGRIVLTTNNGHPDDPRNRIVLEPEVFAALLLYAERG
jgi:hypothetical protein